MIDKSDKKSPKPRTGPTTWGKGKSGNPGGRSPRVGPNGETVAELARAHTADAINTLVAVCNNQKELSFARISAANALLDRGWGKPKESVDIDANIKGAGMPVIQIVRAPADDGAG
jgi:hypothetical protein